MTVVEFFDVSPLQNLSGALNFDADRVCLVGSNERSMTERKRVFERVLARFAPGVSLEFVPVRKYDMAQVVETLVAVCGRDREVIFDVAGGSDYILAAAGVAFERCRAKGLDVRMEHISVRSGKLASFGDARLPLRASGRPALTCDEVVALHGGSVVYAEQKKSGTVRWDFASDDFGNDVARLWRICREDCRAWNRYGAMMGELESLAVDKRVKPRPEWSEKVELSVRRLKETGKTRLADALAPHLRSLAAEGLIRDYCYDKERLRFSYKSKQVRACLVKAGTALELATYLAAKNARTKNGRYVYNDALSGVVLDWDGKIHNGLQSAADTENEIDVLLMRGMIPVFVSCKNGGTDENELYKLAAVAEHFGVKYAKKVLVATDLQKNYTSLQRFLDRAAQMDITVIDGVHKMTGRELAKRLAAL